MIESLSLEVLSSDRYAVRFEGRPTRLVIALSQNGSLWHVNDDDRRVGEGRCLADAKVEALKIIRHP